MDLAEFFTHRARDVVAIARDRGLLFLFDYRGPFIELLEGEAALSMCLRRVQDAALHLLDDGFIFLSVQAEWSDDGFADVAVSVAGTGGRASDARITAVLRQLGLAERQGGQFYPEGARVGEGTCPHSGFKISFAANRNDGILFAVDVVQAPARLLRTELPPHADGARAWLISDANGAHQSLSRRLQRLGWSTTVFKSLHQVTTQLHAMSAGMLRPALVIGTESRALTLEDMRILRSELPQHTQVILATEDDRCIDPGEGIECMVWPFSPHELEVMTRRAEQTAATFSHDTDPVPLTSAERPQALVVDDNPVNVLVASGLLQAAGFEVRTAAGGEEAIARCRERAPQVVLMDVHMPDMDGLQTTHRLRALQQAGVLRDFRIVAATADAREIGLPACVEAGMDGYISKPLTLASIEQELHRVMPGLRFLATSH